MEHLLGCFRVYFAHPKGTSRAARAMRNPRLYAVERLGLARAYAVQGDKAKAKSTYQDVLALWKDADPNIPILKQAKAEYAKLQ